MSNKKKLIAIPTFNEEATIQKTLDKLINLQENGYSFDLLVCNDGSIDSTVNILNSNKEKIILIESQINFGLSEVFNSILFYSKLNKYDSLMIFDADEQYPVEEIINLFEEFENRGTDIHIGIRNMWKIKHFSFIKKTLQSLGSTFVSFFIGYRIKDVTSGFRIYSKSAINNLFSHNKFTYTIETLFQANNIGLKISTSLISKVNETRKSVLFSSNSQYIFKTFKIIFFSIASYKQSLFYILLSVFSLPGFFLVSRFFSKYFSQGYNSGNIQSLTLGAIYLATLFIIFFFTLIFRSQLNNTREIFQKIYEPKHN